MATLADTRQESRAEYLNHLRSLAETCRDQPETSYATGADLQEILNVLQTLSEQVNTLREEKAELERRLASVEKSTPSPQTWKNLIAGIRSIRDTVSQIQKGADYADGVHQS
ncbi:MAG: hypothetical protein JST65_20745 [Acidobacteria bacterium]|nr:hypothetical protein [Acidobacteriota bacterium]